MMVNELKAVHDLRPGVHGGTEDLCKRALSDAKRAANRAGGNFELAWRRGHQAGIHDAYLTIRERFPQVAAQLIEAYGMSEDGALSVGREQGG